MRATGAGTLLLVGGGLLAGCSRHIPSAPTWAAVGRQAQAAGIASSAQGLQTPLPPPEQNAAPLWTQFDTLLKNNKNNRALRQSPLMGDNRTRTLPDAEELAAIRTAFAQNPNLLPLIHQAAARPRCVLARDWSNPAAILFPEYARMRSAVRMLRLESLLMASEGRSAQAVKNMGQGFTIARQAGTEPFLIAYLVEIGLDTITLHGLEDILYQTGGDARTAQGVQDEIIRRFQMPDLPAALRGEAGTELQMMRYMAVSMPTEQERRASEQSDPANESPDEKTLHRLDTASLAERNAYAANGAAFLLASVQPLIEIATKPYPQAQPLWNKAVTQAATQPIDPKFTLGRLFMPAYDKMLDKRAQVQARANVTRASAAVLKWKAQHGAWPGTLTQAVGKPIPDLFNGKPLRYGREGSGFVVYSVGPTGTYRPGKPTQRPHPDDILFRWPLPPPYKRALHAPETPED